MRHTLVAMGLVLLLLLPWSALLAEEPMSTDSPATSSANLMAPPAPVQPDTAAAGSEAPSRGGLAPKMKGDYGVASGSLVTTAIGLVVVLVMIVAAAFLLKRFGGLPVVKKGAISIVGGISLGPRERAVLLQVGDTRVLVGVAPGQVRALHVFGKEEVGAKEEIEAFSRQLDSAIKGAD